MVRRLKGAGLVIFGKTNTSELGLATSVEPLLATLTGFVLLGTLLFVLQRHDHRVNESAADIDRLIDRTRQVAAMDTQTEMQDGVGKEPGGKDDLFRQFEQLYRDKYGWRDLAAQVERVMIAWTMTPLDAKDQLRARLNELIAIGEDAKHRLGWLPLAAAAPLSNVSGVPPTAQAEQVRRDEAGLPRMPAENSAYLGRALFTDFLLPVELGGSLLLVATVGAIAIAHRRAAPGRVP